MFVIVRHGNTFAEGEKPRRIGARTDLPLTEQGQRQAAALGAHFSAKGWQFGRVLVSPLLRTRQTALGILAHQAAPPPPVETDFLREIDHGHDEGQPEPAVVARVGAGALEVWDKEAVPPPGWQIDAEMRQNGWRDLFGAESSREVSPTLLVTSNGAARFALLADPALSEAMRRLDTLKLPTGGYGVISRRENGRLGIDGWGLRP